MAAPIKINETLAKTFLVKFASKEQMKNWIHAFLDLEFPDSHIDPESNSSPIDWMYETYKMYESNTANLSPDVIVISSRESYKTLTESIFSVIMMAHFGATIAHMAAIVPQATAAQRYLDSFLQKVIPYMQHHGINIESQNNKEVVLKMPDGSEAFMRIIVCTLTGANSSHTNIFTIDEIDTIRNAEGLRAFKEAQMIPGVFDGQFPVTIKTSTLKFPGGLFMKEWEKAKRENYKIFKWNILDITEYCPPERHRPDLPEETRYVAKNLPLKNIDQAQFDELSDKEKEKFDKIDAMGGCAKCPLLPICKGRLSKRSPNDKGGLWKPIDFTISQFKKTDPDLAESQLMCWRPSSQGMVYPRFIDKADGSGNTYTLQQAWEVFTGTPSSKNMTLKDLVKVMLDSGVKFYCGVDWGFRHAFAIVVSAVLPNKEWWIMDTYSVPQLEFEQMMSLAMQVRDMYGKPVKWFCDTSQPMFIKAFKRNGMSSPEFKKDVRGGIEAVRGQIVDGTDVRRMKVIKHERNEMMLRVMAEHTFKLDSNGNLTDEPDDSDVADAADALRYKGQNMFGPKGKIISPNIQMPSQNMPFGGRMPNANGQVYDDWMSQKIRQLSGANSGTLKGKTDSGSLIWDLSLPGETDDE